MDQYVAIRDTRIALQKLIASVQDQHLVTALNGIDRALAVFHDRGIDFKEVTDHLDDSLLITDADGIVLYINLAYTKNTGITEEDVLGKDIHQLIGTDKLFTGGAVCSVLEGKKQVFRLSTTYKTEQPLMGYVVGTPLFRPDGSLRQVVACSRPIPSLRSLQDDFETFVHEVNSLKPKSINKESAKELSEGMVGRYGSLEQIGVLIDHVAPTDASILITGESGVGKEVIADEIYRRSLRNDKPYVKINCASIPAHLLESELFGYEKGAFTGANTKGKIGLFEYANNGTLMLDEIGDMSMDLQVKLLRAIQSQEITRIGGTKPIRLNIRFLALTNADLKKKVAEGGFRQDLYYRLNVIPIRVPPLRERQQDLEALCDHFIDRFSRKYSRSFHLTQRQLDYMKEYSWPGNIRELENLIEYLVLCSSGIGQVGDEMLAGLLSLDKGVLLAEEPRKPMVPAVPGLEEEIDFNAAVCAYEKQLLEYALRGSSTLQEAGKKLNLHASTVCRKIKQYQIEYGRQKRRGL